jgi:hypothetical protein
VVGCICIFGAFDRGVDWFKISWLAQSICSRERGLRTRHTVTKIVARVIFSSPGKPQTAKI